MKRTGWILAIIATATAAAARGDALTDGEMKEKILDFVTLPGRLCGRASMDFRRELATRRLTNRAWFDGDTNRLARLLCELAQTNNSRIASLMINQLGEYGTSAQLPFLYSCATNPAIGDRAVKAVLRIEGVTSNSIDIARGYLMSTNELTRAKQHDRSIVCEGLLNDVFQRPELSQYRTLCMSLALDFGRDVNTMHISLDDAILSIDPTYRHSKRRLSVMRSAQYRCVNTGLYDYVTNAISELVAYPEADLPD